MNADSERPGQFLLRRLLLPSVLICVPLWFVPPFLAVQGGEQEVVANLAAGRAVICVASNGIVIGAVEHRIESGSRPPLVVPIGERRVAILLGAVEWISPASGQPPVRLDHELPALARAAARPRQARDPYPAANDIESIGVAFLEQVRAAASQLHHKLDLQPNEPLVELLLVDYVKDYGPEVWLLRYRVEQEAFRGDYWRTRVLRPSYTQFYPPEKGQPHTLIEVRYPDESAPTLLDLLNQNDSRLALLRDADPRIARVLDHLARGESHKAHATDVAEFLRAALGIIGGTDVKQILGALDEQRGFDWVIAPPELPEKAQGKPREPSAPTLRKP